MTTITMTPAIGTVLNFSGNIVYGTDHYFKRLNQLKLECSDGSDLVYDGGPTKGYGSLIVKRISYSDGINIETWVKSTIYYQKYTFSISAITNVNLGNGKNTPITGARFLKNSTEGLLEFVAPGMYNLTFDYSF